MSPYALVVETDRRLIQGETLSPEERASISETLLAEAEPSPASPPEGRRAMAPLFFTPEDGQRVRSLLGQTPKTQLLAGNMVELETLRLLCLLAPEDSRVQRMQNETLGRLRQVCFASTDDGLGECFDASLVTLRFLCAAVPEDRTWIQSRIDNFNRHFSEKKRPWFPLWYFWLCLSEMPLDLALPEIEKHRDELDRQLRRSCVMHSEHDLSVHPVILCMLKNLMTRLPEYAWAKELVPQVSKKDGRLRLETPIFPKTQALQTV